MTANTTYYVAAAEIGCPEESPRVAVEVNVVDIPTAADIDITGDESPICSSNDVILTPNSPIDGTYTWFFDANATQEITDGMVVGGVTYSIDPEGGSLTINGLDDTGSPYTYYVRITEASAGCENAAGDLQSPNVEIVNSGESVTITSNPTISIDLLGDFFQIGTDYNVTGTVAGDASAGDAITLTVNGQSYAGTLDGSLGFDITVDGTDLALDPDGIIDVFIDGGLCTLTGEITITLPTLTVDVSQTFCASDSPTLLDIVVTGNNIVFFDTADGLVELDINTPLLDGEVYFVGIVDVPIDALARVGVTVSLTDPPTPTTSESVQTFCEADAPTIADIQVNEPNVVFYDSPNGGTELPPSTPLTDGTDYYGAIRDTEGCESTSRLQVSVILEGQTPTTNSSTQTFCASDYPTIADIQVNEANVIFYDSPSGGTELAPSTALSDGTDYYVAIRETSGCESTTRLQILVGVEQVASPTTIGTTQTFCASNNPTVADIQTNETNVVFYDSPSGGNELAPSTALADGTDYYVAIRETIGCESTTRLQISVGVEQVASPTTTASTQTFCEADTPTIVDIQVNEANVVFYDAASGGQLLAPNASLSNGDYFVALVNGNGCESTNRLQISIGIQQASPATLNGEAQGVCIDQAYTYTTESGMQNYTWTVTGGTITAGGTVSDDFATVTWSDFENAVIRVQYEDASACATPGEATMDVMPMACGSGNPPNIDDTCLVVFNEFTPNNDGYNDLFEVECLDNYSNTVQIFSRLGNKVFETANYQNNWNGIANVNGVLNKGEPLPSGTYYYVINIPELNKNLVGWIQLAR